MRLVGCEVCIACIHKHAHICRHEAAPRNEGRGEETPHLAQKPHLRTLLQTYLPLEQVGVTSFGYCPSHQLRALSMQLNTVTYSTENT